MTPKQSHKYLVYVLNVRLRTKKKKKGKKRNTIANSLFYKETLNLFSTQRHKSALGPI